MRDKTKDEIVAWIKAFNKMPFKKKLETIRDRKDLIRLEFDNGWAWIELRNVSDGMMDSVKEEVEIDFENEFMALHQRDVLTVGGFL